MPDAPLPADAELEREIRNGRPFTMAEAIGRLGGGGTMKGASPVARLQQAQVEIDDYVKQHLEDGPGALATVIARQVTEGDRLLSEVDRPLRAMAAHLRQVLDSEPLLAEVVREADVEWGRLYEERPYFEREGRPSDPEDPYTLASVRDRLTRLLGTVTG